MSTSKYDESFKREVVAYHLEGHSQAETARKFGVGKRTVRDWKRKLAPGSRVKEGRNADGTFKTGVSGNPKGTSSARQRAQVLLEESGELAAKLLKEELQVLLETPAGERNIDALLDLMDRGLNHGVGKPTQRTELTGADGGPVETRQEVSHDIGTDSLVQIGQALERLGVVQR